MPADSPENKKEARQACVAQSVAAACNSAVCLPCSSCGMTHPVSLRCPVPLPGEGGLAHLEPNPGRTSPDGLRSAPSAVTTGPEPSPDPEEDESWDAIDRAVEVAEGGVRKNRFIKESAPLFGLVMAQLAVNALDEAGLLVTANQTQTEAKPESLKEESPAAVPVGDGGVVVRLTREDAEKWLAAKPGSIHEGPMILAVRAALAAADKGENDG